VSPRASWVRLFSCSVFLWDALRFVFGFKTFRSRAGAIAMRVPPKNQIPKWIINRYLHI
jgi:hypothetical protein